MKRGGRLRVVGKRHGNRDQSSFYLIPLPYVASMPKASSWYRVAAGVLAIASTSQVIERRKEQPLPLKFSRNNSEYFQLYLINQNLDTWPCLISNEASKWTGQKYAQLKNGTPSKKSRMDIGRKCSAIHQILLPWLKILDGLINLSLAL